MITPNVIPFIRRDGTSEFTCGNCGTLTITFKAPRTAFCASCQFETKYATAKLIDIQVIRFGREDQRGAD
jgi:hypothetical protein